MILQEHLPKDKNPTPEQEWGYTFTEFIVGNWIYLAGIVLVLAIFLFARYKRRRR